MDASLEEWTNLEDLEEVKDYVTDSHYASIDEEVTAEDILAPPVEDESDQSSDEEIKTKPPHELNVSLVSQQLVDIENVLTTHQLAMAAHYLEQARDEIFRATQRSRQKKPKKMFQPSIGAFFSKVPKK